KEQLLVHPEQSGTVNACRQSHFGFTRNPVVLMGGTLTTITAPAGITCSRRGGYIGALLGPERTRECSISDDACQSFCRSVG
ncbi:hypothetical protein, partial [Rhodococcus ruber]